MKSLKKAAMAAGCVLVSAVTAAAFPAVATDGAAVRAGPGSEYPVVDRLYPGDSVDVVDRDGGWYLLAGNGWVRASLLEAIGRTYYEPPPQYYYAPPPRVYYRPYDRWDHPKWDKPYGPKKSWKDKKKPGDGGSSR